MSIAGLASDSPHVVEETFDVVRTANGRVGVRRWSATSRSHADAAPLVLLHGFTGSSESWRELAKRFAQKRPVVAIDLPGHGSTRLDVKDGTRGNCAFAAFSWTLDAALREIAIARHALLGYSLGGRLALDHALRKPAGVAALILESASPGIADADERASRRVADEELANFALREGVAAFVDRWEQTPVLATQRQLAPQVRAELRRIRLAASAEGLATSLRMHGAGSMPWLGERLGEAGMPALLISGALDEKFCALARTMAQRMPSARHVVVGGAGHTVHLERAEELAREVETFLGALPETADARTR
jgi:2-succinyl-6-hydroxy-2,4-cyclohexadiene-1-carboxylate synthase